MLVTLHSLSDADILSRTRTLAERERAVTLQLLLHLNEIETRKLHLREGYSSMFDYCTTGLGYSEPSAFRRIRTARCVARFPEVYALLAANQVNVRTISRVSRVLTASNKDALLQRIRHKTLREVDAIVAEYEPRGRCRDVVRSVAVRAPVASVVSALFGATSSHAPATSVALPAPAPAKEGATRATEDALSRRDACETSPYFRREGDFDPDARDAPVTEKRVQFQFTASETFRAKLDKIKSIAWHRLPVNHSLEQVFELTLDCFLEKHDPSARRERREQRQERAQVASRNTEATVTTTATVRRIAAGAKDEVFTRDGHRCTFVAANGRRCAARSALQIDHIKPVARGGASTLDNLRLLCAYHNRFEAERLMGPFVKMRE